MRNRQREYHVAGLNCGNKFIVEDCNVGGCSLAGLHFGQINPFVLIEKNDVHVMMPNSYEGDPLGSYNKK